MKSYIKYSIKETQKTQQNTQITIATTKVQIIPFSCSHLVVMFGRRLLPACVTDYIICSMVQSNPYKDSKNLKSSGKQWQHGVTLLLTHFLWDTNVHQHVVALSYAHCIQVTQHCWACNLPLCTQQCTSMFSAHTIQCINTHYTIHNRVPTRMLFSHS